MAKVKIYSDLESATIFFDGSRIRPQDLTTCYVEAHPTLSDRVVIKSSTLYKPDGVSPRVFFKKLNINRIQDKDGNDLTSSPYNYDRDQIISHLNVELGKTLSFDGTGTYQGLWDASSNIPTLASLSVDAGDWVFVAVAGTYNGIQYNQNDQLIYDASGNWTHVRDHAVTVDNIKDSALDRYDIHVDSSYTGAVKSGSSLQPYSDLSTAISSSQQGDSILIKGSCTVSYEITLPHSLRFYGSNDAEIKYSSYSDSNGDIFNFEGDGSNTFVFSDITFRNAGGYGLLIKKTNTVELRSCKFYNNGWNGTQLNTVLDSSTSGLLGYDSDQASLQAFYAGSNASNGGAVRLQECTNPLIRECRAENNLRGFRVQDCGIGGGGFLIENRSVSNIESGIYLATGSLGGCQNITVAINVSAYNANNGLLCIGGINNKFSQNEVKGNWNAGACAWGSANYTLRDCGLYDNNRSKYNGIGNVGDARASIQIKDAYSFLATSFSLNPNSRFLAEILDTQVHYTGIGSSTERIGFLLTSGMGSIPNDDKNIIKVDDVGFIGQDYAIDLSECDVSNLRVSLGDNSYQNIGVKSVRDPLDGNYFELPFSNHSMNLNEVDISVTNTGNINVTEGVHGSKVNPYSVNELQALAYGSDIQVVLKGSNKIQFIVPVSGCSINGSMVNSVLSNALVQLNDIFTNTTGFASTDNPVTDFSLSGNDLTITLQEGTSYTVDVTTLGVDENKFISSGSLNGSSLELTMNDSSVIAIDVSNMINGSTLPAISNDWFIAYGGNAGDEIEAASIVAIYENKQPFYNGSFLGRGEEYIWTHDNNGTYILGIYTGEEETSDELEITYNAKWSHNFKFSRPLGVVRETSVGVDIASRYASGYNITNNTVFALSYDTDNFLKLYDISNGDRILIGQSNTVLAGDSVTIFMGGENQPNAKFPVMTKRFSPWSIVHDFDNSETAIIDGVEADTVLKSNISIGPNEKFMLNLNHEIQMVPFFSFSYTGASTGVSIPHLDMSEYFRQGSNESIYGLSGWSFNTSATHYNSSTDQWQPANGVAIGMMEIHYKADNSVELYSQVYDEVVATLDGDRDGSEMFLYVTHAGNTNKIPSISKQSITGGSQPELFFAPDISNQSFDVTKGMAFNVPIALDSGSDIVNQYGELDAPSWAVLNQATGYFYGTAPNTIGSHVIQCKAANALGGSVSFNVTLNVVEPVYTNTKSLNFEDGVSSYLGGNAALVTALERSGNGSGSSDAWTIAFWFKSSSNNSGQTLFYFGASDIVNNGHIEIKQTNHNGLKRIRFRYGTNVNHLQLTTPSGSISPSTWQHVMISYNGGTTGVASGSVSDYYSRFKIYIDGALQSTSNTHSNNGFNNSIIGQNYRFGRLVSGNYPRDLLLNQLAIWNSDQSSNISGIYNGGETQDISLLAAGVGTMNTNYLEPDHYYEIEDSVSVVEDIIGTAHFVGYNFSSSDLVTDAP